MLVPNPKAAPYSRTRTHPLKRLLAVKPRFHAPHNAVPLAVADGDEMVLTAGVVHRTAAGVAVGAACAYLLWPDAAPVAMMKAPGAAGLLISRAAFLANPSCSAKPASKQR
ncbi:hypothetical protein BS78_02G343900 [Paspalum vaginatum]|nr:hypothetical protein BS78_02G343900 [Paspalum vaginatum]